MGRVFASSLAQEGEEERGGSLVCTRLVFARRRAAALIQNELAVLPPDCFVLLATATTRLLPKAL